MLFFLLLLCFSIDSIDEFSDLFVEKRDDAVRQAFVILPTLQGHAHNAVQQREVENNGFKIYIQAIRNISRSSICNNYGVLLLNERKYDDALKCFTTSLKYVQGEDSYEPIYHMNIALCLFYSLLFEKSVAHFSTVITEMKKLEQGNNANNRVLKQALDFKSAALEYMRAFDKAAQVKKELVELDANYTPCFHYRLLPPELMVEVFKFADHKDSFALKRTCSEFLNYFKVNALHITAYSFEPNIPASKIDEHVLHYVCKRVHYNLEKYPNLKHFTQIGRFCDSNFNSYATIIVHPSVKRLESVSLLGHDIFVEDLEHATIQCEVDTMDFSRAFFLDSAELPKVEEFQIFTMTKVKKIKVNESNKAIFANVVKLQNLEQEVTAFKSDEKHAWE